MANRPANAGSGDVGLGGVGSGRRLAPRGAAAPPHAAAAAPSHAAAPARAAAAPPRAHAPRPAAGHRATRSRTPGQFRDPDRADAAAGPLAWRPYLIVLAGAGLGMFLATQGAKYAGLGTGLLGGSLLVAALLRLALPECYAGLLATRRKASDVLAFAAFGVAVLAVALTLP
jgi:Protein of unknown function (DUF3017)